MVTLERAKNSSKIFVRFSGLVAFIGRVTHMGDEDRPDQHGQNVPQPSLSDLARRHVDWLHSAAKRMVHDEHLAQDLTQAVFLVLLQRPDKLPRGRPLAPWLFTVLRRAAARTLRDRKLQRRHETKAAMTPDAIQPELTGQQWREMEPMLEELVAKLGKKDREVVLLRFYQQLSFTEVGQELGISEEAAQKRTARAVAKLRDLFARRGVAVASAAVLTAGLSSYTVQPAGAAVVAAVTAVVSGGTVSASVLSIVEGVMKMMVRTKAKVVAVVCGLVLLAGAIAAVVAQQMVPQQMLATTQAAPGPSAKVQVLSTPQEHAQGRFRWRVEPDRTLVLEFRCVLLETPEQRIVGGSMITVVVPGGRPVEIIGSHTTTGNGTALLLTSVPALLSTKTTDYFGGRRGDAFISTGIAMDLARLSGEYVPFAWGELAKTGRPVGTVFYVARVVAPEQRQDAAHADPPIRALRVPASHAAATQPTQAAPTGR